MRARTIMILAALALPMASACGSSEDSEVLGPTGFDAGATPYESGPSADDGEACADTSRDPDNCGTCGHVCASPAGRELRGCWGAQCVVAETIASAPAGFHTASFQQDDANLYWLQVGEGFATTVMALSKAGGEPVALAAVDNGMYLVNDTDYLYWMSGMRVQRVAKAGGAVATIQSLSAGPKPIAVDSDSVYWVETVTHADMSADTYISKAPKVGGAASQLTQVNSVAMMSSAQGHLYWLDGEWKASLWSVALSGGAPKHHFSASASNSLPSFLVAADEVVWCDQGASGAGNATLWRLATPDAAPTSTALASQGAGCGGLITDGPALYWWDSESSDGQLLYLASEAATLETLLAGTPSATVVDGEHAYLIMPQDNMYGGAYDVLRVSRFWD